MQKRIRKQRQELDRNVPDFITKLYKILEDKQFNRIISWNSEGDEIQILSPKRLQAQILPKYFRHHKIQSFIRQLNNYGFSKVTSIMRKSDKLYFRNPYFVRGNTNTLNLITRKQKKQQESTQSNSSAGDILQNIVELAHELSSLVNQHPNIREQIENTFQVLTRLCEDFPQAQQKVEEQLIKTSMINHNLINSDKYPPVFINSMASMTSIRNDLEEHLI